MSYIRNGKLTISGLDVPKSLRIVQFSEKRARGGEIIAAALDETGCVWYIDENTCEKIEELRNVVQIYLDSSKIISAVTCDNQLTNLNLITRLTKIIPDVLMTRYRIVIKTDNYAYVGDDNSDIIETYSPIHGMPKVKDVNINDRGCSYIGIDFNNYVWVKDCGEELRSFRTPGAGVNEGIAWGPDNDVFIWSYNKHKYFGKLWTDSDVVFASKANESFLKTKEHVILTINNNGYMYKLVFVYGYGTKYYRLGRADLLNDQVKRINYTKPAKIVC